MFIVNQYTSSAQKPLPPALSFPSPTLLRRRRPMRHLVAAAKTSRRRRFLFSLSPYHQLSTSTTSGTNSSHLCSFYDPAAQFLPSGSPRHLSLPTSLRRDSLLDLARILKSSLQCHLALRTLTSQTPPLHARFAAASRLAILSPALRPFASLLLAALLPAASPHLLAWCASPGGAPYAALRLALHAFLAAGMPAEALVVLARIRSGGKTPSHSALATLLRLLFREGNVQAAWKVFVEMTAMGPRPSLAIFNAMIDHKRSPTTNRSNMDICISHQTTKRARAT